MRLVHKNHCSMLVHKITGVMKFLSVILLLCAISASDAVFRPICKVITWKRTNKIKYVCSGLTNLERLDRTKKNTTDIEISESNITRVPSHTFARFGVTLVSLDLHSSGIETIEPQAFIGLTMLKRLILWGNKLKWVPRDWFLNTYNLQTLDVSFNSIQDIDYQVYQMLPLLENFYFDYNQLRAINFGMFPYLSNLKRVKFGMNPLNWAYRARLTWQLENQHVTYTEEWESWAWMNAAIKNCIENGRGEIPYDTVLDCLVEKLLDFTYDSLSEEMKQEPAKCIKDAERLVRCVRPKNGTGDTDNETMRMILENYVTILPRMAKSQGLLSLPSH